MLQSCADGVRIGLPKSVKSLFQAIAKIVQGFLVVALDFSKDGLNVIDQRGPIFLPRLNDRQVFPGGLDALGRGRQISMGHDDLLRLDRMAEQLHQVFRQPIVSFIFRPPPAGFDLLLDR